MSSEYLGNIPGVKVFDVKSFSDSRGVLIKPMEAGFIDRASAFGEVYVIHATPGSVRGKHYHKKSTEWFCVISGRGLLVLEEAALRDQFVLDARKPTTVMVPPGVTHAIKNIGSDIMTLLVYWNKSYDVVDTDTYPGDLGCDVGWI